MALRRSAMLLRTVRGHGNWRSLASARIGASLDLTENQVEIQKMAQEFANDAIMPHAARWDREHFFPIDTLRKSAELGLGGLFVGEKYGGTDLSRIDGVVIFEALSYADISFTAYLTIHNMVAGVLNRFASEELKQRYLPRLASMQALASYCLTEPGSGSDAASLQTTAARDGPDHFLISGSKAFISGAGASDVYLVMARTGGPGPASRGISAFIVEKGMPGVSFGKPEEKMGWRSQPTAALSLDRVRVPASHLVGAEGQGFKIAMAALDGGRVNIAACSVGGAQFCLDYATSYVQQRKQFGRPLSELQHTQFQLADMATDVQASRLLVRQAARSLDAQGPSATMDAAMAKRFATDSCYSVADRALQLLGGYGYLADYPVERFVRDLRVHSILEGTNQVMRLVIHREMQRLQG